MARDGKGVDAGRPQAHRRSGAKPGRIGLMVRLRNYFLAGILVTAPIGITIWVTWNILAFIDARATPFIPPRWNPESYLPFGIPGLGLIFIVLVLTAIGFLTAGLLGRVVMRHGEDLLARVPVVRSIYGATKQIFETVLAQKSTAFRQVALVEYPSRGIWAVGFITGETVGEVQDITAEPVFNVFIPATPNPTTGFLLFIPDQDVHILDMTVEEGIKLVVSGGIVTPPDRRKAAALRPEPVADVAANAARPPQPRFGLMARLRNYFLAGVLVTAPISITFWLSWKFISFVDNRVTPLIPPHWNPEFYLPFDIPGLGLVVALIGFTVIGMLTAGFTGRLLMRSGERLLARVPVVRGLYSAVKQIMETVLAQRSKAFRDCVLLPYPRQDSWAIGFITGQTEGHVQEITGRDVVNVFLPTTPNPTSGFLLIVPREKTVTLSMTVEEGLKMVVSGGIVTPPDRRPPEVRARSSELLRRSGDDAPRLDPRQAAGS